MWLRDSLLPLAELCRVITATFATGYLHISLKMQDPRELNSAQPLLPLFSHQSGGCEGLVAQVSLLPLARALMRQVKCAVAIGAWVHHPSTPREETGVQICIQLGPLPVGGCGMYPKMRVIGPPMQAIILLRCLDVSQLVGQQF